MQPGLLEATIPLISNLNRPYQRRHIIPQVLLTSSFKFSMPILENLSVSLMPFHILCYSSLLGSQIYQANMNMIV